MNGINDKSGKDEFDDSGTSVNEGVVDLESGIEMGKKAGKTNYITKGMRRRVKLRYDG